MLGALYDCFMKNAEFYNIGIVMALVDLFREVEGRERADKMFSRFVEIHKGIPGSFDTSSMYRFGHEIPDDMKEEVAALNEGEAPSLTVDELFLKLEADGFHSKVADRLAEVPVEEYVRVLTIYDGESLAKIRRGLTADLNIINPNEASLRIMDRAGEALSIIGKENTFNARRARSRRLIQRLEATRRDEQARLPKLRPSPPPDRHQGQLDRRLQRLRQSASREGKLRNNSHHPAVATQEAPPLWQRVIERSAEPAARTLIQRRYFRPG